MHVMAVKIRKKKQLFSFLWSQKHKTLNSVYFLVSIVRFGTSLLLIVLYNEKVKHKEKFSSLYFGLQETNLAELWIEFLFLCCVLKFPVFAFVHTGEKICFLVCCRDLKFPKIRDQLQNNKSCKYPYFIYSSWY